MFDGPYNTWKCCNDKIKEMWFNEWAVMYLGCFLSFHSVVTLNYLEFNILMLFSIIAEKLQMDW